MHVEIRHLRDLTEQVTKRYSWLERDLYMFKALAEISLVGVFSSDANGLIEYVNPKMEWLTGLSSDNLLGQGWLKIIPEDKQERFKEEWAYCVSHKKVFHIQTEYISYRKENVWAVFLANPILPSLHGGHLGVITDIPKGYGQDRRKK